MANIFFQKNPTIFIESTIHAREWITAATATYLLNELLTSNDPEIIEIANNYDWVFVPVVNVDGYVYSHTRVRKDHTVSHFLFHCNSYILCFFFQIKNRMWRKTRSRRPQQNSCFGVDANRNLDFHHAGDLSKRFILCSLWNICEQV